MFCNLTPVLGAERHLESFLGPSASEQVPHLDVVKPFPPEWLPPDWVLAVGDVRRPSLSLYLF